MFRCNRKKRVKPSSLQRINPKLK